MPSAPTQSASCKVSYYCNDNGTGVILIAVSNHALNKFNKTFGKNVCKQSGMNNNNTICQRRRAYYKQPLDLVCSFETGLNTMPGAVK